MAEPDFQEAMRGMHQKSIQEKAIKYGMLNKSAIKGQTVFTGSSLMEFFPIDELQAGLRLDRRIYNRGLAGAMTADLIANLDVCLFDLAPTKLFMNIGSNDIGSAEPGEFWLKTLLDNYGIIMDGVKERLPKCVVYVMAYYPVNPKADFGLGAAQHDLVFKTRTNENIQKANSAVKVLAEGRGLHFIDVNDGLSDEEGNLKAEYAIDGIHMWPNAYQVILDHMKKYF